MGPTYKTLAGESRSAHRRFTHFHIQPEAAGNSEDILVTHRSCGAGRCGPRSVYTQDYREPKTVPGGQGYKSRPHHHVSCWPTSGGVVVQQLHFPPPGRVERKREKTETKTGNHSPSATKASPAHRWTPGACPWVHPHIGTNSQTSPRLTLGRKRRIARSGQTVAKAR